MTAPTQVSPQLNGDSVAPEKSEGFRVFVGNLSFEVDSEKLQQHFEKAGKIIEAFPVKRFGRASGYGFVIFEDEESIEKALALKDSELCGRNLNVEKAIPASERPARRGRGRGRGRGFRGRGTHTRREPPTGEPSKTVLFVGNLPFNVIDQDLLNIFEPYQVENANVVRYSNGASRGFGFVTLKSEDEQQKALANLAEVWCDDRKLIIRPAISTEARPKSDNKHDIVIKESDA